MPWIGRMKNWPMLQSQRGEGGPLQRSNGFSNGRLCTNTTECAKLILAHFFVSLGKFFCATLFSKVKSIDTFHTSFLNKSNTTISQKIFSASNTEHNNQLRSSRQNDISLQSYDVYISSIPFPERYMFCSPGIRK